MAGTDIVAWWGAALSTLLGATTLYDRFARKPIPIVSAGFTTSADEGSTVMLVNPTATPLMISGWDLFWAKPSQFGLAITEDEEAPDLDEWGVILVPPHETKDFNFAHGRNLRWGHRTEEWGQLYLRLSIVGRRRAVVLFVYSFSGKEPMSLRRLLPHGLRPSPRDRRPKESSLP